ncbi:MAG TPA: RDD family protein [Chryseolinea sp.]
MQTIRVRTTQNVFIEYPLASVGERIAAYLVDWIILIMYTVALVALLAKLEVELWYVWLIVIGVPWMFFSLLFEIFMDGQTPGKLALKVKVVRLDGTPPAIGDYLMRWIFSFIDFYILSGAVAVVIIAVGGKGQRLGDIVAGTSVVKIVQHHQITSENVFIAQEEQYTPTFSQVISLTEKDIDLIQRALEVNRDQGNIQPVMIISDKIKALLNIQTDLPPVKFLYTIIKDYQTITAG